MGAVLAAAAALPLQCATPTTARPDDPRRPVSAAGQYLRELLRIDSTPGHEQAIAQRACDQMRALGYHGVHVDQWGNAIGRLGSGWPCVLVDCHLDTIPLHDKAAWTYPPFGAQEHNGRVFGLGASDMKGALAAATHGLADMPPTTGTVVLCCSVAEETMEGAALRGVLHAV